MGSSIVRQLDVYAILEGDRKWQGIKRNRTSIHTNSQLMSAAGRLDYMAQKNLITGFFPSSSGEVAQIFSPHLSPRIVRCAVSLASRFQQPRPGCHTSVRIVFLGRNIAGRSAPREQQVSGYRGHPFGANRAPKWLPERQSNCGQARCPCLVCRGDLGASGVLLLLRMTARETLWTGELEPAAITSGTIYAERGIHKNDKKYMEPRCLRDAALLAGYGFVSWSPR